METVVGPLGFVIPVQSLSTSQEVKLTPADIGAWCQTLPVADLGAAAKKIYYVLGDCNKVKLEPADRFAILEQLHPFVKMIYPSLSKRFTNQSQPLNKQQLMMVNITQTFLLEMANGYKLVVEEGMLKNASETRANLLPKALQKIIYYNLEVLFQNYQLYTVPPKGIWKELHLAFKIAEENKMLDQNNLLKEYKRAILLSAADPYRWNQSEQRAYYKATLTWADLANLHDKFPHKTESGLFMVDLNEDKPPTFPIPEIKETSPTHRILDVNSILDRIKTILATLEPNELKAKISYNHEPEYGVSVSMLKGLIKEWGKTINRLEDRAARSEPVKICVGLIATHYYLNNQQLFLSQQNESTQNLHVDPLALTVQEETEGAGGSITSESINFIPEPLEAGASVYPLYSCTLSNENSSGYGLLWSDDAFLPIQSGEIIAIEKIVNGAKTWEIGKIHWLQHQNQNEFRMGIEKISKTYTVGAAQIIENGKPVGSPLRCLLLGTTLLTPTLPFKTHHRILFTQTNETTPITLDLTDLVDATGSYKQFAFISKQFSANTTDETEIANIVPEKNDKKVEEDGEDAVWKQL